MHTAIEFHGRADFFGSVHTDKAIQHDTSTCADKLTRNAKAATTGQASENCAAAL